MRKSPHFNIFEQNVTAELIKLKMLNYGTLRSLRNDKGSPFIHFSIYIHNIENILHNIDCSTIFTNSQALIPSSQFHSIRFHFIQNSS